MNILLFSYHMKMTVLTLYEFSELTQNMITNIGMIIEKNIKIPFVWNPEENKYDILICVDKTIDIIVGVGIVLKSKDENEWNELKYLCVIEQYRNKGIASKMVNNFLKKYTYLYLKIAPNKEAYNFYLKKYHMTYEREKDKNVISLPKL
jgi:GNAT superfamily N-acetyltransferase